MTKVYLLTTKELYHSELPIGVYSSLQGARRAAADLQEQKPAPLEWGELLIYEMTLDAEVAWQKECSLE